MRSLARKGVWFWVLFYLLACKETHQVDVVASASQKEFAVKLQGKVWDGPVAGASLQFKNAKTGEVLKNAQGQPLRFTTDSRGSFLAEFSMPFGWEQEALVIESQGGLDTGGNQVLDAQDFPALNLQSVTRFNGNTSSSQQLIITPLSSLVANQVLRQPDLAMETALEQIARQTSLTRDQLLADPQTNPNIAQVSSGLVLAAKLTKEVTGQAVDESQFYQAIVQSQAVIVEPYQNRKGIVIAPEAVAAGLKSLGQKDSLAQQTETALKASQELITVLSQQAGNQASNASGDLDEGKQTRAALVIDAGQESLRQIAQQVRQSGETDPGKQEVLTLVLATAAQKTLNKVLQTPASSFQSLGAQSYARLVQETQMSTTQTALLLQMTQPLLADTTTSLAQAAQSLTQGTLNQNSTLDLQKKASVEALANLSASLAQSTQAINLDQAQQVAKVNVQLIKNSIDESFVNAITLASSSAGSVASTESLKQAAALSTALNIADCVDLSLESNHFAQLKSEAEKNAGVGAVNCVALSRQAAQTLVNTVTQNASQDSLVINLLNASATLDPLVQSVVLPSTKTPEEIFGSALTSQQIASAGQQQQTQLNQSIQTSRNEILVADVPFTGLISGTIDLPQETGSNPAPPTTTTTTQPGQVIIPTTTVSTSTLPPSSVTSTTGPPTTTTSVNSSTTSPASSTTTSSSLPSSTTSTSSTTTTQIFQTLPPTTAITPTTTTSPPSTLPQKAPGKVTASVPAGSYGLTQTVNLSCASAGLAECTKIYYTLDGSQPSPQSFLYTGPLLLFQSTVLKFFAVNSSGVAGAVGTVSYVIDTQAPVVLASLPEGTYASVQSLILTCQDAGGGTCDKVYYTLDGSTPTKSSAVYSQALTLSLSTTLTTIASDSFGNLSKAQARRYLIDSQPPTVKASQASGLYRQLPPLVLSCEDSIGGSGCDKIYFTTDGQLATTASNLYRQPLEITQSLQLSYVATDLAGNLSVATSANFRLDTAGPEVKASKPAGEYNADFSVTLTCQDLGEAGCESIYYTLDGSTPSSGSTPYTQALTINSTVLLRAVALDTLGNLGTPQDWAYRLDKTLPLIQASPAPGLWSQATTVQLSCQDFQSQNCSAIYYTLDGSSPSLASTTYSGPLLLSHSQKIRALGRASSGQQSRLMAFDYVIDTQPPEVKASQPSGTYTQEQSLRLECSDGAGSGCDKIYYTLDGSLASTLSAVYTGELVLNASAMLRFIAQDRAGWLSSAGVEDYVIDTSSPQIQVSPSAGTYNLAQTVTLSCQDSGTGCQAIHYTTNGLEPTRTSPLYQKPFVVEQNTLLKALSLDQAGRTSEVLTAHYAIDRSPPQVKASLASGTYNTDQDVTLICQDAGGGECDKIYYTLDTSTPSQASRVYSTSLALSQNTILKFFAQDKAGNAGEVLTRQYVIDQARPAVRASLATGAYSQTSVVSLLCNDPQGNDCARIYYTLNGDEVTANSFVYTQPLSITQDTTLKFLGVSQANHLSVPDSRTYTIDRLPPSLTPSPAPGSYATTQAVSLTCSDTGGSGCDKIYYTTDGTAPTPRSDVYQSPLVLVNSTLLKVLVMDKAGQTTLAHLNYVIDGQSPEVTLQPAGKIAQQAVTVQLTCQDLGGSGCDKIYYTLDNSTPTASRSLYTTPLDVTQTSTLRALAMDQAGNLGTVSTAFFVIDSIAPILSWTPNPGLAAQDQTVRLTCNDEPNGSGCAKIYYTTDGSAPSLASNLYQAPLLLSQNTKLQVQAWDNAGNSTPTQTLEFIIDKNPPRTEISPQGGIYAQTQTVRLNCADDSGYCKIYYTTNGSTPTSASSLYVTPLSLTQSTTLKFRAIDSVGNQEAPQTAAFTIDTSRPLIYAFPLGGYYAQSQNVKLTCQDHNSQNCTQIYYTSDGRQPSLASLVYNDAISVNQTSLLQYFGVSLLSVSSLVTSTNYIFDFLPPKLELSPAPGVYGVPPTVTMTCRDEGRSGCAPQQYYTLDGSQPTRESVLYQSPIRLNGSASLRFLASDLAGNSPDFQFQYIVDQIAPTVTMIPEPGIYQNSQIVTLTCQDTGGSECDKIYYTTNGEEPSTASNVLRDSLTLDVSTMLKVRVSDKVGNLSQTLSGPYFIDRTGPKVQNSKESGFYNRDLLVTLTCEDFGASGCDKIYYTLDGSTPSLASLAYTQTLTISQSTTLNYLALDKVGNWGNMGQAFYGIDRERPTVKNTPFAGFYYESVKATLECSDTGGSQCSRIYYTLDGTEPNLQSLIYTEPLVLSATTSLRFLGLDLAGNLSAVQQRLYTVDRQAPVLQSSLETGLYRTSQSLSLSCLDRGGSECALIYFTTNGQTPTPQDTLYTQPLNIENAMNFQAIAYDGAGNRSEVLKRMLTIDRTPPVVQASPTGGLSRESFLVTLTCQDLGGGSCDAIYYTTDGNTPDLASSRYSTPLELDQTAILVYRASDTAGNLGNPERQTFQVDRQGPVLTMTPKAGLFNKPVTWSVACQDRGGSECLQIYVTADGSPATTQIPAFVEGELFLTQTTVLNALAIDKLGNLGNTVNGLYEVETSLPLLTLNPPPGLYNLAQTVTISCVDSRNNFCDGIYYTTNGTAPSTTSLVYSAPLRLTQETHLKVVGLDTLGHFSRVQGGLYRFDSQAPQVQASLPAGAYGQALSVTLECVDQGGSGCEEIYYTWDGSPPTPNSSRYQVALAVNRSGTLKALARDGAGNLSQVLSVTYTIDREAPLVKASPAGDFRNQSVQVTLTCQDFGGSECAAIRYTLDGSSPNESSPLYQAPLTFSQNSFLYFAAWDQVGNRSATEVEYYRQDFTPPVVSLEGPSVFKESQEFSFSCLDQESGCDKIYVAYGQATPNLSTTAYTESDKLKLTQGGLVKLMAIDRAGNQSGVYPYFFNRDDRAPQIRVTPRPGAYNRAFAFQATCQDLGVAGCDAIYYTVGNTSSLTLASSILDIALPLGEQDGIVRINLMAVDKVGNQSAVQSFTYLIDKTKPAVSVETSEYTPGQILNKALGVNLSCADLGGSDCASIYYTTDGSTPSLQSNLYQGPLTFTQDVTLKFMGVDGAGNQSPVGEESYQFDVVAPTLTLPPSQAFVAPGVVMIELNCTDSSSGCLEVRYTTDGSDPRLDSQPALKPPATTFNVEGSTTVRAVAVDKALNFSPEQTVFYKADFTPPAFQVSPSPGSYIADQTLQVSCQDDSGCLGIHYALTVNANAPLPSQASPVFPLNGLALTGTEGQLTQINVSLSVWDRAGRFSTTSLSYQIDKAPLKIVSTKPVAGSQTGISNLATTLEVSLNKPIVLPANSQVTFANSLNQLISFNLALTAQGSTLLIASSQPLPASTYTTLIRDLATSNGSPGIAQTSWSFNITPRMPITQLGVGENSSCALYSDGQVDCWGGYGALVSKGLWQPRLFNATNAKMNLGGPAVQLSTGSHHACAVLTDGRIQCWGQGDNGALGNGSKAHSGTPVYVSLAGSAVSVAAGLNQTCALLNEGQVKCWGNSYNYVLGIVASGIVSAPEASVSLSAPASQITLGNSHGCALLQTGAVQCWGDNNSGQLGNGLTSYLPSLATTVMLSSPALQISARASSSCALLTDGAVMCWGENYNRQVGVGNDDFYALPQKVGLAGPARQVTVGRAGTCAVLQEGTLQCWGSLQNAFLFNGAIQYQEVPRTISLGGAAWMADVSTYHTCAMLAEGSVKCWGRSIYFSTGNNNSVSAFGASFDTSPLLKQAALSRSGQSALPAVLATTASLSDSDSRPGTIAGTISLTAPSPEAGLDGYAFYWGSSATQKLGESWLQLPTGARVLNYQLAATTIPQGVTHLLIYSRHGQGESTSARAVALQDRNDFIAPSLMAQSVAANAVAVSLSPSIGLVFDRPLDPNTFKNGIELRPTLGGSAITLSFQGTQTLVITPTSPLAPNTNYTLTLKTSLLSEKGTALGQSISWSFTTVDSLARPLRLTAGKADTCALLYGGQVKCWGANSKGQLGQGDATTRGLSALEMGDALLPIALGTSTQAFQVVSGQAFHCVLITGGKVKCWGDNSSTQLALPPGNRGLASGQMGDSLNAVNLGTGRTALQLAAGANHACALLDNGNVKCWGANESGQLGQGDTRQRGYGVSTPDMGDDLPAINLGTGRTARQITAGRQHTCALLDDGSLKCWGNNEFGQLGAP